MVVALNRSQRITSSRRCLLGITLLLGALTAVGAAPVEVDPLKSPSWESMASQLLHNETVVFDEHVVVVAPTSAEDSLNVPVSISIQNLNDIEQVVVFSDLNPIPKILTFKPVQAMPYLEFRFKVQQSTPIRAAARTKDGVWHVGGQWIDAAGGGCTTASVGMSSDNWTDTLGQVSAKRWNHTADDVERLRLQIMHPMDTGLAPGIPAFHLTQLDLLDGQNQPLMQMELFEPVQENPVLSFNLPHSSIQNASVFLRGTDNNGNRFYAEIQPE